MTVSALRLISFFGQVHPITQRPWPTRAHQTDLRRRRRGWQTEQESEGASLCQLWERARLLHFNRRFGERKLSD